MPEDGDRKTWWNENIEEGSNNYTIKFFMTFWAFSEIAWLLHVQTLRISLIFPQPNIVSHHNFLHNKRGLLLKWENDSQYVHIKFLGVANCFLTWFANSASHIFQIILRLGLTDWLQPYLTMHSINGAAPWWQMKETVSRQPWWKLEYGCTIVTW